MISPAVTFAPKSIWHPNVDFDSGNVCAVESEWGPTKMMADVGKLVHELLLAPKLEGVTLANPDAAREFAENAAAFEASAKAKAV